MGLAVAGGAAHVVFSSVRAGTAPELWTRARQAVVEVDGLDNKGNLLKTGTAFFVNQDGLAVTTRRVVEGVSHVLGVSGTGAHYSCERVAYAAPGVDLALIKFAAANVTSLPLGDSRQAVEGQKIVLAGPPGGLPGTDSDGVISEFLDHRRLMKITAPVWPGASGAPVLNQKGEVIAVAVNGTTGDGQGSSLAIPAELVSAALLMDGARRQAAVVPPTATPTPTSIFSPAPAPASQESAPPPAAGFDPARPIGKFMQAFMHSWNSGAGLSEIDFYADRAHYCGEDLTRATLAKRAAAYNARWPKRKFWLIDNPVIERVSDSLERVRLKAGFAVENAQRRVKGEATYNIDLVPTGDSFRVTSLEEQITRRDSQPVASR
ncbi:MAG: trypsin-like peptidase domain-containing protein [Verrucomicrobia bacterium]|nr:trypsin-like peptidase domain-containing protein [Verrucomicrobiota bacterium]